MGTIAKPPIKKKSKTDVQDEGVQVSSNDKIKCQFCSKNITKKYMRDHINSVHNVQKDHKCDSCGKAFSKAGNLKRHINSAHNG